MSKGTSKTMTVIKMLPLLQYVFPEIKNAFYHIDQDTKEELVTVNWRNTEHNGCGYTPQIAGGEFNVCVSCDSVSALVDDVWKECKRRFG